MSFLNVGNGPGAIRPCRHKIQHVPVLDLVVDFAVRTEINVLQISGFREHVHAFARAAISRGECVLKHGEVECSLVPNEAGAPLIAPVALRNWRSAPGAVLPANVEVRILEDAPERVGNIGRRCLVHVDASRGSDRARPAEAQEPAHLIDHVHAQVADGPIAVLHEGTPVFVLFHRLERGHRRRPGPHFVIQVGGHRCIGDESHRAVVEVAVRLDQPDLAEPSASDVGVPGVHIEAVAAALGVHLDDATVLARRCHDRLPFDDVDPDGLLEIQVGARLDRREGGQRMPMVGCRDNNDVVLRRAEHLAVVRERPGHGGLVLGDQLKRLVEEVLVNVTQ